jgi:hypothetical protein
MPLRSRDGNPFWHKLANPRKLYSGIIQPANANKARVMKNRDSFERRLDRIVANAR